LGRRKDTGGGKKAVPRVGQPLGGEMTTPGPHECEQQVKEKVKGDLGTQRKAALKGISRMDHAYMAFKTFAPGRGN